MNTESNKANDLELLMQSFIEASGRRGILHHVTLTADGQASVAWQNHKETFTPANLRMLLKLARERQVVTEAKK